MEKVDRPRSPFLFWAVALTILFVILYAAGPLRPVGGFLRSMTDPIAGAFSRLAQKNLVPSGDDNTVESLRKDNEALARQIEDLTIENAKLTTRLTELEAVSQTAAALEERTLPYTMARTTNVFSFQDASSIFVDRGAEDGVKVGQAVVFRNGFLVGVVREVFPNGSRVRLVFDNNTRLSATFVGDGSPEGIVEGELGLSLHMELIPRDLDVQVGTTVLTAGVEEAIPPGLVIGSVSAVSDPGSDLFKTAQLIPQWDISELTTVAIITL